VNILKNKILKLTLVNKKTKKRSSSHTWWQALGAHAHLLGDDRGIASLLPHSKGQKLLRHNFLTLKNKRPRNEQSSRSLARQQAYEILPRFESIYRAKLRSHQKFQKQDFCKWIKKEINKPSSLANEEASKMGMGCIVEGHHSVRWWMDQRKKMQSSTPHFPYFLQQS
jgi:hypothetical protein